MLFSPLFKIQITTAFEPFADTATRGSPACSVSVERVSAVLQAAALPLIAAELVRITAGLG